MSKKIGKYKVGKHESTKVLADGGAITGTIFARVNSTKKPSITQKFPAHTGDFGAGAETITVAQILTGIFVTDPTDAATTVAWALPTAALLVAGWDGCAVGDTIDFSIINTGTASADEIITLAGVTSATLVGSGAVLTSNPVDNAFSSGAGLFRIRITAITGTLTYHCYRIA